MKTVKGSELEYTVAKHPFYDRDSLVMLGARNNRCRYRLCSYSTVTREDDFVVGKKYGLEVLCPVDDKGVLTEEAPDLKAYSMIKLTSQLQKN